MPGIHFDISGMDCRAVKKRANCSVRPFMVRGEGTMGRREFPAPVTFGYTPWGFTLASAARHAEGPVQPCVSDRGVRALGTQRSCGRPSRRAHGGSALCLA